MLKLSDIKSEEMVLQYVESLMNDFEAGLSTKEETEGLIIDLIIYVVKLDRENLRQKEGKI